MSETCHGFYDRVLAPRLVHGACKFNVITEQRRQVVPAAEGVVVEIGIGSGLNLPHYNPRRVSKVIGVDPSANMLKLGQKRAGETPFKVELLQESAESMSLEDKMADTVLVTYSLCSIPDVKAALHEMRRVLKPDGRLLFCEHGRAPKHKTAEWQDWINPAWQTVSGGCNINRNISRLVQNAGFEVDFLDNYTPAFVPSLLGYHYVGTARVR